MDTQKQDADENKFDENVEKTTQVTKQINGKNSSPKCSLILLSTRKGSNSWLGYNGEN